MHIGGVWESNGLFDTGSSLCVDVSCAVDSPLTHILC